MSATIHKKRLDRQLRKCPIASLPNEVFLEIFRFLTPHDLFNASLVNRRWKDLASDPSVWHFQTIDDSDVTNDLHTLSSAPTLHTVHITKVPDPDRVYGALITGHKDIKSLTVCFAENSFNVAQICELLHHFPNLQQLDIQIPASTQDRDICAALKTLRNLQSLTLSGVVTDTDQYVEAFVESVSLRALDISGCRVLLRDEHLAWLLNHDHSWETLRLVTHFITDQGYHVIAVCNTLQELALLKCRNLSQRSLEHLASLTNLRTLAIKENCVLSAAALTSFFKKDTMGQLVKVDLTVYRADDDVALAVATSCSGLMHLRLAMCLLTDKGVRDIVLNAPRLTHLDLEFNNIRGDSLHLIPKFLPNLTYLNLHLCYNVHINLFQLAETLPNFTIVDPVGLPISTTAQAIQSSHDLYT